MSGYAIKILEHCKFLTFIPRFNVTVVCFQNQEYTLIH